MKVHFALAALVITISPGLAQGEPQVVSSQNVGFELLLESLTPSQEAQVTDILEQSRARMRPLLGQMKALQPGPGKSLTAKAKAQLISIQKTLHDERNATRAKSLALLTAEQKRNLASRSQ